VGADDASALAPAAAAAAARGFDRFGNDPALHRITSHAGGGSDDEANNSHGAGRRRRSKSKDRAPPPPVTGSAAAFEAAAAAPAVNVKQQQRAAASAGGSAGGSATRGAGGAAFPTLQSMADMERAARAQLLARQAAHAEFRHRKGDSARTSEAAFFKVLAEAGVAGDGAAAAGQPADPSTVWASGGQRVASQKGAAPPASVVQSVGKAKDDLDEILAGLGPSAKPGKGGKKH
jgi:hypothetical protein